MRQSRLVGTLAAGVIAVTTVAPLGGQQLGATVNVPQGALALGTVALPRSVVANGRALSAGAYEVHLTPDSASPETNGALTVLERWVEFRQDDTVRGREVVTIVPEAEIGDVAKSSPPREAVPPVSRCSGRTITSASGSIRTARTS